MTRIQQLFQQKKKNILSIYFTAGYPRLHDTLPLMLALQEHGADMIELGMPYSDPLADGPVIQASSARALENGMTIRILLEQLREFRKDIHLPVILMGYLNPVLQYGLEAFCAEAAAAGVDGLILPDLPDHAYEKEYGPIIRQHGLDFIFLVTPETPEERVRRLDQLSSGFLYAVSTSSTTGSERGQEAPEAYLQCLQVMGLNNPVLLGFGIRDREGFKTACRHAAGAIVGSAFIKALKDSENVNATTKSFLASILG